MIDVYGYCERLGPELLAEPLNALTNASFLIAAGAAWLLARRLGRLSTDVWVLLGLAFSVLPERRAQEAPVGQAALAVALAGAACRCTTGSSTALSLDARGRVGESQRTDLVLPQACAGAASS